MRRNTPHPNNGPIRDPNPAQPPGQPLPPPGTSRWIRIALATLALTVAVAAEASAAGTGGGAMPYSSWLTTFRDSVSGEVALTLSVICIVAGVVGWVAGGELTGMLMYIVRAVCGIAIVLGAVAFLGTITNAGATLAPAPALSLAAMLDALVYVMVALTLAAFVRGDRHAARAGAR